MKYITITASERYRKISQAVSGTRLDGGDEME